MRSRYLAPIDPTDRLTQRIKTLEQQVAELQRLASELQRRPGDWQTITLASPNWTLTRTPEWRLNGGRIELRGFLTRTTSTFGAAGNLFSLGSAGNPPTPAQAYNVGGPALIAAATPDATYFTWIVDVGVPAFRSSSVTFAVAVGDGVSLDKIWWPA